MTKSIEEQAVQYAYTKVSSKQNHNFHYAEQGYVDGAKARDAQFLAVVTELREALKKTKSISVDMQESDMNNCCSTYSKSDFEFIADKSITKADQMLKEMGI